MGISRAAIAARLPVFYGWVVVAVAFVTMALGVNARTAFSLIFLPILDEFGWERGVTAGAFSFGFVASAILSPLLGQLMDRRGPRVVIELGVLLATLGLALAPLASEPWHLYVTLGMMVGGGGVCLGYTGQSLFLPHWFVRQRGLAMGVAFSGVGAGSVLLLPWLQGLIETGGWRTACWSLAILVVAVLGPLNLLLCGRPSELGLAPDGDASTDTLDGGTAASNVMDAAWVAVEWTLARAVRTARFWWIAAGYFCGLYAWYAVQVHQTKYLVEVGFSSAEAAWALGLVSLMGIPGQIGLGHLSDRIGREHVWAIGSLGFALCYVLLLLLAAAPSRPLLYAMVAVQGTLGYSMSSVFGAIPAEIFAGRRYGSIFGMLILSSVSGAAVGPWVTGALYDRWGSYTPSFVVALACCAVSAAAVWQASPRKVRAVAGRARSR
ncbi:MAG: MFS transporter [Chloroflexota bacterium]